MRCASGSSHLDQFGATAVIDAELVAHGEELRRRPPLQSAEAHLQAAIKLSRDHIATFRDVAPEALKLPLTYPDPTAHYHGYDYHAPAYGDRPGTRLLTGRVTWAAAALAALKTG